jgi:hypothetical protein
MFSSSLKVIFTSVTLKYGHYDGKEMAVSFNGLGIVSSTQLPNTYEEFIKINLTLPQA